MLDADPAWPCVLNETGRSTSSLSDLYVDESKSRSYVMVATVVPHGHTARLRRDMRSLVLPGQRRIHFTKESDDRKRLILSRLSEYGVGAHVFDCPAKDPNVGREACLGSLVAYAAASSCTRIVLERDESVEQADRRALFREVKNHGLTGELTYVLETPHAEPLLWIADAVAWSYAKRGDWMRRVRPLILGVTAPPG